MFKSIVQLIVITFVILFLFNISHKPELTSIQYVNIGDARVKVTLAITEQERMIGLSGKESLGESEGLLFIFDKPDKYSFWMKDMNFPIDIIWLDADLKIVDIKHSASPLYFPETYISDKNAIYVLEVVSGFSEKNNLKVGDRVTFTY